LPNSHVKANLMRQRIQQHKAHAAWTVFPTFPLTDALLPGSQALGKFLLRGK